MWQRIVSGDVSDRDIAMSGSLKKLKWMVDNIHLLRGKELACYCELDATCHAQVLLEMANKED
jgi:hypothetical protein